jgi:aquaglyceroporin related protein
MDIEPSKEVPHVSLHPRSTQDSPDPETTPIFIEQDSSIPPSLRWTSIRAYCRDAFSEFFGTMILILFGDGVVAQVTLSRNEKGSYQSISWGWG